LISRIKIPDLLLGKNPDLYHIAYFIFVISPKFINDLVENPFKYSNFGSHSFRVAIFAIPGLAAV